MNLPNSTKKKNSVPVVDFRESKWALVRLLLRFDFNCCKVHNACLKSGLCVTGTVLNLACSNEATSYSYGESILVRSNGECDLHLRVHPIVDNGLRLDDFQSFDYGVLDLV